MLTGRKGRHSVLRLQISMRSPPGILRPTTGKSIFMKPVMPIQLSQAESVTRELQMYDIEGT